MRLIALALTLAVAPAAAQIGNPAGVDPATPQRAPGVPAPHYANTQDKLFAQLLAEGGLAEVELGKLAQQKAASNDVREFARRMVEDHTKSNERLKELARQANIPLPTELGPEHKMMKSALEGASGRNFDLAYMRGQIVDHQKAVVLLQYAIGQGQEAELQRFAAETLPTVLAHLDMAKTLAEQLAVSPRAGE